MSETKQKSICEIGSRLNPARGSLRWLDEIDQLAEYYLALDPYRAGAAMLSRARKEVALARKAIKAGNAPAAALAAMATLQSAWRAEMTEARKIINSGATAYRRAEAENARRHEAAEQERDNWRRLAETIRRNSERTLTKREIAAQIAKTIHSSPESALKLAAKIRKYI